MKKLTRPSSEIQDSRDPKYQYPDPVIPANKAAETQKASALGLSGQAADLQNTANKLVATRRTRMANADLGDDFNEAKMIGVIKRKRN